MKKYKLYLSIVLFYLATYGSAQQGDYISGKVADAEQKEPVPFATIRIKDRALGVISNIDGTFKIPLQYKTMGEILEISCLGFETRELKISDLKEEQVNTIFLKASAFELTEAVVSAKIKRFTPKEIVRIAINSIPQNYPLQPFGLVGYYRDYQIKNGEYTNLNEALIQVFDDGFSKKDNFDSKYKLLSYSQNKTFKIDSFSMQPYDYTGFNKIIPGATIQNEGGNEFITLNIHDAIRNYGKESFSFIDNLAKDFLEKHTFKLKKTTIYNKQEIYEIDIVYRDDTYLATGTIFINKDDFGIHKLDYSVYKRKKPGVQSVAVNEEERHSDGFKKTSHELVYHILTEYTKGNDKKMYLNYISFYNKMLIKRPATFKSKFIIDLNNNTFKISVNNMPVEVDQIKNRDFKVSYKNQPIPIKTFSFLEELQTFVVSPDLNHKPSKDAYKEIFMPTKTMSISISDLQYAYGNIKDSLGNKLDEQKLEFMHQYREFFTQQVIPEKELIIEDSSSFMIKTEPLDSFLQPIYMGDMKNDYWMNTPLPGLEP